MNLDQRKLSILLVLVYIVFIALTAFILFTLQDDLIYEAQVLVVSEIDNAHPVFIKLYLAVGATFLVGLGVLYYLFNNKGMEIIYVEKKEEDTSDDLSNSQEEDSQNKKLDLSSIQDTVTAKAKSEEKLLNESLMEICKGLEAGVGAFYMLKKDKSKSVLQMNATYAMSLAESQRPTYELGEGLVGQVGQEKQALIIDDIPEGYIKIVSGLGSSSPRYILISPVLYGDKVWGVVEIATFTKFTQEHVSAVEKAFQVVTKKLFEKTKTVKKTESSSESKTTTSKKRTKKA